MRDRIGRKFPAVFGAAVVSGLMGVASASSMPAPAEKTTAPASLHSSQNPDTPLLFQTDGEDLLRTRDQFRAKDPAITDAVASLRKRADKALPDGPYSVTQKKHPLPGVDVHEYVSLAPYHWPNPDTPDHLPYVRHDGKHNPEVDEYDVVPLTAFSSHVYTLAVAGYITGDEKYLDRAALLIRTFLIDPATRMNPEMEHAQLIKGENTGRHAGLLDTRRLLNVVDAIGLLRAAHASSWSADDDAKINDWFKQYVDWMQNSETGKGEAAAPNNHGTWYDVQVVTFRLFINDFEPAKKVLELAKTKRIKNAIEPDGSEPKELVRTKSLSYSVFNLIALSTLATMGERTGVDLWHYKTDDGRSIQAVLNNVLPYTTGEKKWEHEQIVNFNPQEMLIPLRRAARVYGDPAYTSALETISKSISDLDDPLPGTQF